MEGREFAAPAHLLSERGALVHRAASRISTSGHGSVQHAGPFPPGKYYPSPHLPMPTHSGSGLMGNSSASFMGTFLASSLGSPPSHPPHPSRPPSSPSSPPYRGGPHSSASQIWFPHSHEAPGYPRFSGSLAHTFLPISHLDHHANSGVLYGQHRFYDTQKENFYLRSLPSQPPLISANHGIPPMSRTGPGHPQGSCSRDAGGGMNLHKGLKDAGIDRGVVSGTKDNKERPSSKQEDVNGRALERHKASVLMEYKDHSHSSMSKPLSACLMNGKMQNGDSGGGVGVGVGAGAGSGISEQPPSDCLERSQALHQSLTYSVPPPLPMGSAAGGGHPHPGGFHCLQLHPRSGVQRDPKVTGPTFVPSVGHLGEKVGAGPFQLGHPECQGSGSKDKAMEKASGGGGGHAGNWHRKHRKGSRLDAVRSRSADCINSMDSTDVYRPAPVQEPKTGHPLTHPNGVNPQSYRDCSHTGPPPNSSPLAGKTMAQQGPGGASCSMQRDGQKVARIRHQQHGRAGSDASSTDLNQGNGNQEMKRKMEMSPYGYGGNSGQHHSHQQPPVPPWPQQQQQPQHQSAGMGPPGPPGPPLPAHPAPAQTQQESLGPQGEGSAMKNLLKYSNQQQPLLLSQKSPFGGLGSLKTAHNNNTNCTLQAGKPTLPSRKGPTNESERPDCGGRSRDIGEAPHVEGEVRQPPVGIAVAVARQRDPTCRPPDNHPSSRQGRVHSAMKGAPRSMYPPESPGEEERKRMSGEHIGHPCLDREDNKERVEFARIHPSNSCHGDLPSHIMVPGGNSLQSGQLGDPAAHAHSAHHHWMPRTGSPSLWMTGHSYGISHTALHQNLPPGFSAAMPAPLQPVLPLPQDPSAQLVVLPSEPASHPATHHLDVMEQPGLWPPVYRARGPPSHMQHPAVYSRSQFLRQQELYALQQHQQLQQQQQHPGHQQPPQTPQQHRGASPPPRASTLHLSPCCQSPCMHPHPKSTASTPCPAASPAATAARSPAISPAPPQLPKAAESQDKRAEGQPPQDYPQTMEPDVFIEYNLFFSEFFTGEEQLIFDLQSLATLAAARALEFGAKANSLAESEKQNPGRRILNLRRKCTWTPRHEPVCPVKGSMEAMDGQELAMRVRLAELQRRYKEKQKELAKLQRKHDHQKEETPRSPARRGPGRPRKRKSTPGLGPAAPPETQKKEDEGSENSDEGQTAKSPASRELPSSSAVKDPSPSSVVKLEANQKAKNKRERQELYGKLFKCSGDPKKAPCRSAPVTASKPPGVRRRPGRPRLQEKPWTGHYHKPPGLLSFTTTSERLRRATRKSSILRGTVSKPYYSVFLMCVYNIYVCVCYCVVQSKGRAVSRLLESFAADEGFRLGEDSSFSDEDEEGNSSSRSRTPPAPPNCVLSKDQLTDGLRVLICKEDELLYAARVRTVDVPDIYSIVIDGERGNRPRIYSLEQLLQEAVLEVRPETEAVLTEGTRVCAYWSERSRCLYPGYVRRGGASDECKPGGVMVEFDDGDRGRISLHNIRFLPPGYQVQCKSPSTVRIIELPTPDSTNRSLSDKMGRPKGSGLKRFISDGAAKNSTSPLTWPSVDVPRKRAPVNLFQLNGSAPKKALRNREAAMFPHPPVSMTTPAKGIFSSSSFEVDSFSSIANGYSSFCSQTLPSTGTPLGGRSSPYGGRRRSEDPDVPRGRKNEFLIKLDHEGVTSPKNKSSKALLLLGGSGFGPKGLGSAPPRSEAYSHPVLLVKDSRKGDSSRAELLPIQRKPSSSSSSLRMGEYGDLGLSCHRDCHSSYSGMDEEEEEEEEDRRRRGGGTTMLPSASGSIRTADRFLSRLSVSSSSSGSSSSSSSGSLSSSSLCSSDNDSSYSSEDEESSTLLLQSCLTPHRSILQPPNPKPPSGPSQHTFVAKAVALPNAKSANANHSAGSKPLKRKECTSSPSKPSKDLVKRQKMLPDQSRPKASSSFLPARQLWRWSGSPTQRRGLKGKARKLFYKAVVRGRDMVRVGDCAVFLSTGRPQLPYVGRIESFWESWSSSMVVKVKWFYHPEETKLGKSHRDGKHALYQSCHEDENDVQTISHKCQVVSREEYERVSRNRKPGSCLQDLYYLAGTYDPTSGQLLTADRVSIHC
uniref:BAH domain and coiled-coil containing 1 n=1 Tax=Astyanax mexicanus TaxID=7994 RepID=A0A3B1IT41_ASTMX